MPRFMLDTDTCSYVMKRTSKGLLNRLVSTAIDDVCISVVTRAELEYGVEVSPRQVEDREALTTFLRYVRVFDLPAGAAPHYAEIRADLKRAARSSAPMTCSSPPMPVPWDLRW